MVKQPFSCKDWESSNWNNHSLGTRCVPFFHSSCFWNQSFWGKYVFWKLVPSKQTKSKNLLAFFTTVDGRNPAPVDMVNIPLFTRFYICQVARWCRISSINSIILFSHCPTGGFGAFTLRVQGGLRGSSALDVCRQRRLYRSRRALGASLWFHRCFAEKM